MEPVINLSYFDRRNGPTLFYSYPEAILDEDLSHMLGSIMEAVYTERIFTYSFKDISLLNYYFEIRSSWTCGGQEILMLTFVFQRNSLDSEQKIIDLFKKFQNRLDSEENTFTGFYINDIESREEIDKKIIVKNNSLIKLYIKELYLSILENVKIKKKKK
jgi:hypothetical protein